MFGRRRRIGAALGVLAIAGLGAACGPRTGSPSCAAPGGPPDAVTSVIFNRVNGDRAYLSHGSLGALGWNDQLYCLAADWSGQMASSGSLHHRDLGPVLNSEPYSGYSTLGENILRGPASMSGDDMENAWMNSPEHRANIMSGSYSSIGIGLAYTGGTVYATQNFGG